MYKLEEIIISNYKSIKYANIKFSKNKTVFVGKNNAGKSNILKAIKLFFSKELEINLNSFYDKTKEISIEAIILKDDKTYINLKIVAYIENNDIKIKYENNYELEEKKKIEEFLNKVDFVYIPSSRNFGTKNNSWYSKIIDLILKNKIENVESQEILTNLENIVNSVKQIISKDDNIQFNSFSNIPNFLQKLKSNDENEIIQDLNSVIKEEEKNEVINFDDLSIGTKNSLFIALLDLYYKSLSKTKNDRFKIFVIDHVENFLHPHSIRLIDKLLQDISETENTQIIYSTHANELVSNFKKDKYEIDSIRFVYKLKDGTQVKKIENKYGTYDKIMINLIFKNTDIFFSDAVILVEGETEKISIPNIYEYWPWTEEDISQCKINTCKRNIGQNKINDFFNLYLKNIAVIDVGGKGALSDWYEFCSELLGKKNVFAIIDRDANFFEDKRYIERSIKKVHGKFVKESQYMDYNWIVLDGEFENYYKPEKIKEYLSTVLTQRYKDDYITKKEIKHLIYKIEHLKINKKISVSYEKLFKTYLRGYGKPTIAFNLCIWLCQNNGYKRGLMEILKNILFKIEENNNLKQK
ncbi:MAG: AAA family ATPase [Candidatus Gracilibacteria bacterium]|nr:AAA family ATPase [Candidatus Gracilibacteria bacterium]